MTGTATPRPTSAPRAARTDRVKGRAGLRGLAAPLALAVPLGLAGLAPLALAVMPDAAGAQDAGGVRLRLGLQERIETDDNLGLDGSSEGQSTRFDTDLSFNLSTTTRVQSLSLNGTTALRYVDGPGADLIEDNPELASPRLRLNYTRRSASARLTLNASTRTDEIAYLRPIGDLVGDGFDDGLDDPFDGIDDGVDGGVDDGLDDGIDDGLDDSLDGDLDGDLDGGLADGGDIEGELPSDLDGGIDLPDDIDELTGRGTRRDTDINASLRLGEGRPLGLGFSAGVSNLSYDDVTSDSLFDSTRTRLGVQARADLTAAARLNAALQVSRFESDDPDRDGRETYSLDTNVSIARPRGAVTAGVGLDNTEDGTRVSLSLGRTLRLPTGGVSANVGATRDASGDVNLTGTASVNRNLADGSVSARLRRSVTSGNDDDERLVTALTLDYDRPLTRLSSLSLDFGYVDSTETFSGLSTSNAQLGASLSRRLTPDWSMSVGYRHLRRDSDTVDRDASSNSVYVTLGRSFDYRF